jgi:sugar phosphate isomerase/epimerase
VRLGIIHSGRDKKAFHEIEEMGLSFIEICCNSYGDMEKVIEHKEEIKAAILDTGVTVSSVGRWNHTLNCGNSLDGRELEGYFSLLDTAIELGAKTFVVGINYSENVSLYENYSVAIDFFSRLIERAKGKIKIAVQNCDWNNFIVSPREWEVVLGHLPELYLKYDPSHAYNRGAD